MATFASHIPIFHQQNIINAFIKKYKLTNAAPAACKSY